MPDLPKNTRICIPLAENRQRRGMRDHVGGLVSCLEEAQKASPVKGIDGKGSIHDIDPRHVESLCLVCLRQLAHELLEEYQ